MARSIQTFLAAALTMGLIGCTATGPAPAPKAPPAPEAPQLVQPLSDAPAGETIYTAQPTLEWRPAAHADGYGVYVSEYDGQDWQLVYNAEAESGGPINTTSVTVPPGRLSDDGEYRWNVRGWNNEAGWGPYSQRSEFQVDIRTDAELHKMIHEHLERAPNVDAANIEVSVANSEVTLAGCVPTEPQRGFAHEVAHSVGGVGRVVYDDLGVC